MSLSWWSPLLILALACYLGKVSQIDKSTAKNKPFQAHAKCKMTANICQLPNICTFFLHFIQKYLILFLHFIQKYLISHKSFISIKIKSNFMTTWIYNTFNTSTFRGTLQTSKLQNLLPSVIVDLSDMPTAGF